MAQMKFNKSANLRQSARKIYPRMAQINAKKINVYPRPSAQSARKNESWSRRVKVTRQAKSACYRNQRKERRKLSTDGADRHG